MSREGNIKADQEKLSKDLVEYFYCNLCNFCKSKRTKKANLKRCSGCKLVYYCSSLHQKEDWSNHKPVCSSVKLFLSEIKRDHPFYVCSTLKSFEEWIGVRSQVMLAIELNILKNFKRTLSPAERQIFMFPRYCRMCFKNDLPDPLYCPNCLNVNYCSNACEDKDFYHRKECTELELCMNLDMELKESLRTLQGDAHIPIMDEYTDLPETMMDFLDKFSEKIEPTYFALQSECFSCVLTIIHVLSLLKFNVQDRTKLTIHLVGASFLESILLTTIEVMFHWLPQLKHITVILVGPEKTTVRHKSHDFCTECSASRTCKVIIKDQLYYHDYVKKYGFIKPDLLVAFNSGFHTGHEMIDTWSDTLHEVMKMCPLGFVFTSYTLKENEKDLEIVLSHQKESVITQLLKKSALNPFRSLRPYRDWQTEEFGVFYHNFYYSVIQLIDPESE